MRDTATAYSGLATADLDVSTIPHLSVRHLLGISELTAADIAAIITTAVRLRDELLRAGRTSSLLKGRLVVNLFAEGSTRTRSSFELAERRMGCEVLNFNADASSFSKGETLLDTVRNIEAMHVDAIVIRHAAARVPWFLAERCRSVFVNAGDGRHEHPTQALLDAMTLCEYWGVLREDAKGERRGSEEPRNRGTEEATRREVDGRETEESRVEEPIRQDGTGSAVKYGNGKAVEAEIGARRASDSSLIPPPSALTPHPSSLLMGKRITIVGDVLHGRVALSNLLLLKKLGAEVAVCGPPTLIPRGMESFGVRVLRTLDEAIDFSDALNMLRVQRERQDRAFFPSMGEYTRYFGLGHRRLANLRKDLVILHPGPINRGIELDSETADGPRSVILQQVENGVAIRMAVLAMLLGVNPDQA